MGRDSEITDALGDHDDFQTSLLLSKEFVEDFHHSRQGNRNPHDKDHEKPALGYQDGAKSPAILNTLGVASIQKIEVDVRDKDIREVEHNGEYCPGKDKDCNTILTSDEALLIHLLPAVKVELHQLPEAQQTAKVADTEEDFRIYRSIPGYRQPALIFHCKAKVQ